MTPPIRIRFPLGLSVAFLALGLLLLVFGLLSDRIPNAVLGALLLLLGGLQATGVAVVVDAREVVVRNALRMTVRRMPIEGWGDLRIDGSRLVRDSDGRPVTSISRAAVRAGDVERLRAAIATSGAVA